MVAITPVSARGSVATRLGGPLSANDWVAVSALVDQWRGALDGAQRVGVRRARPLDRVVSHAGMAILPTEIVDQVMSPRGQHHELESVIEMLDLLAPIEMTRVTSNWILADSVAALLAQGRGLGSDALQLLN